MKTKDVQQLNQEKQEEKRPYAVPSVIYTGKISTRAGSSIPGGDENQIDPADLFTD